MTVLVVIAAIVVVAVIAARYGADSRGLRDHPWDARGAHRVSGSRRASSPPASRDVGVRAVSPLPRAGAVTG
jgi:hypothetical protein